MKVLLDVNVLLHVLLVRQPWFGDASRVWDAHHNRRINALVAAFSFPTIFYNTNRRLWRFFRGIRRRAAPKQETESAEARTAASQKLQARHLPARKEFPAGKQPSTER
jgi:hypothetical protein